MIHPDYHHHALVRQKFWNLPLHGGISGVDDGCDGGGDGDIGSDDDSKLN